MISIHRGISSKVFFSPIRPQASAMDNTELILRPPLTTPERPPAVRLVASIDPTEDEHMKAFERLGCSPETKREILSFKRIADQIRDEGVPPNTYEYLQRRLSMINCLLQMLAKQCQALGEVDAAADKADSQDPEELMAKILNFKS